MITFRNALPDKIGYFVFNGIFPRRKRPERVILDGINIAVLALHSDGQRQFSDAARNFRTGQFNRFARNKSVAGRGRLRHTYAYRRSLARNSNIDRCDRSISGLICCRIFNGIKPCALRGKSAVVYADFKTVGRIIAVKHPHGNGQPAVIIVERRRIEYRIRVTRKPLQKTAFVIIDCNRRFRRVAVLGKRKVAVTQFRDHNPHRLVYIFVRIKGNIHETGGKPFPQGLRLILRIVEIDYQIRTAAPVFRKNLLLFEIKR